MSLTIADLSEVTWGVREARDPWARRRVMLLPERAQPSMPWLSGGASSIPDPRPLLF